MTRSNHRMTVSLRVLSAACALLLCAFVLPGCSSQPNVSGDGQSAETSSPAQDLPGAVPVADAKALFAKVGTAMQSSDIPPADVDVYSTVLAALDARQAAAKESKPATGPSEAAIGSASKLWQEQFDFADNVAVARAIDDVTAKLTSSSDLSDAEAIVWVTARDVTEVLGQLGDATAIEPEADGWVKVTLPAGAPDGGPRTVRVKVAKDGAAWRVVGMDFGGVFASSKTPPTTK